MLASARTSSSEKHRLLARVVSERLLAGTESLAHLAGNMAVGAIPYLSSKHLRSLGVLTVVSMLKPAHIPAKLPASGLQLWYGSWLERTLSPLLPIGSMTYGDYTHLESVSCILYLPFWSRPLQQLLLPPGDLAASWDSQRFLEQSEVGKHLAAFWESGMKHARSTSVGKLIGVHTKDLLTGRQTVTLWD